MLGFNHEAVGSNLQSSRRLLTCTYLSNVCVIFFKKELVIIRHFSNRKDSSDIRRDNNKCAVILYSSALTQIIFFKR